MATYVLIHNASSDAWYRHRMVPKLLARGHDVVLPDLPWTLVKVDRSMHSAMR